MKNIFCLFERPFKIQKNGVFLFEISFFVLEILKIFSCKQYDVIIDLICIIENKDISKTKKDISKRKTPFFCILKGLSIKQKIFFMSYAL